MAKHQSKYLEIIDDLRDIGADFRINDMDESLEVTIGDQDWRRMNDTLEAIIKVEMRELGYGTRQKPSLSAMRDAYIKRASLQRYHPIKDYLESLEGRYKPESNGKYVTKRLASYFDNPDGQFETWLFYWLTGSIAKIYQGERNPMLVLVGEQRTGKSYFAGWLCPQEKHFRKGTINPDSKDANLRLADTWVWEVEELGATTRRADIEALKSFITKPHIIERPPYGKHPIHKPACCNFIGTVNPDGAGFLNDPTGSSRFLACEIEGINFNYSNDIDIDDLWAEAWYYYNKVPGCWELCPDDKDRQAQINESYEITSALTDIIENLFDITNSSDDWMSTQEIRNKVSIHYRYSSEQAFYNELARVLHKMGLKKRRQTPEEGNLRGWQGIKPKNQDPPI